MVSSPVSRLKGIVGLFGFFLNHGLSMTERGERVSKELEIDKNGACVDSL